MAESKEPRGHTVYGRSGSPTVTIAWPFSRVEVRADDALPAIAELGAMIARLARALDGATLDGAAAAELAAIATAADGLVQRVTAGKA